MDERTRLETLLARFELTPYRDEILALGSPCISMALVDPPSVPEPDLPPVAIGHSKVGGDPDLPPGVAWPADEQGRAGFFLQIALADLPVAPWNPLPASGMCYLFCHDDSRPFWDPPGWEVVWWQGNPGELQRRKPEPDLLNSWVGENSFFTTSVARPLTFRAGTDFPPGSSQDWEFVNDLERRTRDSDPDVLDRYFEFVLQAADPGVDADRARGRGPYFHPIGRLLGHTDPTQRENMALLGRGAMEKLRDSEWRREHRQELAKEGAAWRQFLRLEANSATRYMGPCDASPVFVIARDEGLRPWMPLRAVVDPAAK